MKNQLKLFVLCCLGMVFFTSCQKDDEIQQKKSANYETVQAHARTCGMEQHMAKLLADPEYKTAREARMKQFDLMKKSASLRAQCTDPVILPMAVHFQDITNPDTACLRSLAQAQIDILNADYSGTNSDISKWVDEASAQFPGVSNGEACIKFCLASLNHPSGFGLSDGDLAVTFNATSGDMATEWAGYINVFVQPNTGLLGYSPLGGAGNGDGVVVDAAAFSTGSGCGAVSPNAPYNLGRTLTHELGHYLLLNHTWGDGNGCADDDGIDDTPNSQVAYYGCPSLGASSCNSADMHMNYMDYTNDACMYMFSAGQARHMENYVTSSLQAIVAKGSTVCGGAPAPTCDDGIQNGQETGVDCGGPDCPPCQVAPTCSDSIQNGQETGIDCGGPDCPPCATCTDSIQNGQETGIDCGGPDCPPCATCDDGVQNGQETGIDCGGPDCAPCATCTDSIQNGQETGIDCGGPDCPPCATCDDGAQNGQETGVDCGGPDCAPCATGGASDIFLRNIVEPKGDICGGVVSPLIRVKNVGDVEVTTLTIDYGIPGVLVQQYQWTGSIAAGAHLNIRLPEIDLGSGTVTMFAETSLPNGVADMNPADDKRHRTIIIGSGEIMIKLATDKHRSETTWYLADANGEIITSGGPYSVHDQHVQQQAVCLPDGCYSFFILDAYGDGICCDHGKGSYEILGSDGGTIVASDGQFGFYERQYFCVTNGKARLTGSERSQVAAPEVRIDSKVATLTNVGQGSILLIKNEQHKIIDKIIVDTEMGKATIDLSKYDEAISLELKPKSGKTK